MFLLTLNKKILSILIIFLLILPIFFLTNQKADAIACIASGAVSGAASTAAGIFLVPTVDPINISATSATRDKECGFDFFINILKRILVRTLVQDTVNWINSGFEGKPSWGQSLTGVLKDNAHRLLDNFLYQNEYTRGLCAGHDLPLKFAIQLKFYTNSQFSATGKRYTPKCTLDSAKAAIKDVEDFYKNNEIFSTSFSKNGNFFW